MKKSITFPAALVVNIIAPLGVTAGEDPASELMAKLVGSYRTTELKEGENPMWDRRQVVELSAMGTTGVYWQLNTGEEEKLYRQRLLTFRNNDNGSVTQLTWNFAAPEKVVNQFNNTTLFAALTEADVEQGLPDGCEQVWRRDGDSWLGVVDPATCRLWSERREQWRRIGAEARLYPDALWQVERGFDDDMKQLFGTPAGEYHKLDRVASEP